MHLDPVLLARIQFAFTISFHILFPSFTIGLSSWLAVVEWRWLRTGNKVYREVYHLWSKVFAVTFGMGVVSGVVMSYEIGTNWAGFADKVGNVIGPLLGYEVLTAFFLESSFLGIMLFGWKRVSPRMHFTATLCVAFGTLFSAFWILSANSWMQTPQGYTVGANGNLYPADWLKIIFNPSFPYRFAHMVTAAYLTTSFVVGGFGAWYLYRGKHHTHQVPHGRVMLGMAALMAIFVAPLQLVLGDMHGLNTFKYQPTKVAAIEGAWETESSAPLRLFAIPDFKAERNRYSIEIPRLGSLVLTHDINGTVRGLKEWPEADRPPVLIVFFAFRIMVGLGLCMAFTGLLALILHFRKRLFDSRLYQLWAMAMTPAGFLAILCGWFVTETGRQPWIAYGVIRTTDAASPLLGPEIAGSLLAFVIVYLSIFGAGTYYILRIIAKGPGLDEIGDAPFQAHSKVATPFNPEVTQEKR